MGSVTGKFNIYVYRTNSPCLALKKPSLNPKICQKSLGCKIKSKILENSEDKIKIIGIGKDGHFILGPKNGHGKWHRKGIDVCNGVIVSAESIYSDSPSKLKAYVYVSTQTFPYTLGCFGKGNFPDAIPECSKLAPNGYIGWNLI